MRKYLCAIPLPADVAAEVSDIQQSYKSAGWKILIEPHITVLAPCVALADTQTAEKLLAGIAKRFKPFDVEVGGIGRFPNSSNAIYASVAKSDMLDELRDALLGAAPMFCALNVAAAAAQEFHPHVTLANKLNEALAIQIQGQLHDSRISFAFPCTGFALYKKDNTDLQWIRQSEFSF